MRSLIGIKDFSVKELQELIERASDIIDHPEMYSRACSGKTLATLFFEPSTRTRLSFEAAMYGLGGNVLGFQSGDNSSASKGESVADTAKVISGYADIIAMRHPKEGAPMVAALNAEIPVINAGDGGHQHPTQTLTDLLTIYRKKGRLDHLVVGFCGDLKYGRTVHSLIEALARYSGIRFVLISPEELRLPGYVREETLKRENLPYVETASLEEALPELDILYMTRIQRERFSDLDTYERLKDAYVLDVAKMDLAKKDLCVMHPLPRVNEISVAVDADPRACYFEQAKNGKFIRMALILMLLEEAEKDKANRMLSLVEGLPNAHKKCNNPNCISHTEQELPMLFQAKPDLKGRHRCFWCESREDLLP